MYWITLGIVGYLFLFALEAYLTPSTGIIVLEAYLTPSCVQAIYESVSEVAEDPKMVRKAMKSQAQCASKEERCEILQVRQRLREQSSVCAKMIERQRGKETETRA